MASNNIFSSSDEDFDIFPVRSVYKPKKSKRKLNLLSPTVSTVSVFGFDSEDEPVNLPKKISTKTLTSKQADKKIKKIKSGCNMCQKSYCLPCFNETHFK